MQASITDIKRKIFARLGEKVRIAGIADIGPRLIAFRAARFDALTSGAQAAFSKGFDLSGELEGAALHVVLATAHPRDTNQGAVSEPRPWHAGLDAVP